MEHDAPPSPEDVTEFVASMVGGTGGVNLYLFREGARRHAKAARQILESLAYRRPEHEVRQGRLAAALAALNRCIADAIPDGEYVIMRLSAQDADDLRRSIGYFVEYEVMKIRDAQQGNRRGGRR